MEQEITISGKNLSIGYVHPKRKGDQKLYHNLSFELLKGELVCLLGANGSGKSTLLRTLGKMQPALDGCISILNKDLNKYQHKELAQLVGVVLTDKSASGGFTVREVVELGRYPYTGFFGQLDDQDRMVIDQALKDVGIAHKADNFLADLSDGERQKVMIAKVLSQECPIILLDEPTAFLDIESRIEIMSLLHDLAHQKDKTILLSTHDIDLAFLLSDRLWLLSKEVGLINGVPEDIILSGTIDNFFSNDKIAFNKYSGSFHPIRSSERKIYVDAQEEFLFWTINLLLRLNLDFTTNKEEAIFTIEVKDQSTIRIIEGKDQKLFSSFGNLASYLRSYSIDSSAFASHI